MVFSGSGSGRGGSGWGAHGHRPSHRQQAGQKGIANWSYSVTVILPYSRWSSCSRRKTEWNCSLDLWSTNSSNYAINLWSLIFVTAYCSLVFHSIYITCTGIVRIIEYIFIVNEHYVQPLHCSHWNYLGQECGIYGYGNGRRVGLLLFF